MIELPGFEKTENEIRYRIKDPSGFEKFRRKEITKGVSLLLGKKKGQDGWEVQALRFDKEVFSLEKAKKWVKEHPNVGKSGKSYSFVSDSIDFESVEFKGEKRYFVTGLFSTPDLDLVGDIATDECLEDMAAQLKGRTITVDVEHEAFKGRPTIIPVAKIVEAVKKVDGVWVKAELNKYIERFEEIWGSLKGGFLNAFSFAFKPIEFAFKTLSNGTRARILKKIQILNGTFTGNPVNQGSQITEVFVKSIQDFEAEQKEISEKEGGNKSPPKGYPKEKGKYADPKNYRYPLDSKIHVLAAIRYFAKPKNREQYSFSEQKEMWKRIIRAAKKFGIKVSDEVKKKAGEKTETKSCLGGRFMAEEENNKPSEGNPEEGKNPEDKGKKPEESGKPEEGKEKEGVDVKDKDAIQEAEKDVKSEETVKKVEGLQEEVKALSDRIAKFEENKEKMGAEAKSKELAELKAQVKSIEGLLAKPQFKAVQEQMAQELKNKQENADKKAGPLDVL